MMKKQHSLLTIINKSLVTKAILLCSSLYLTGCGGIKDADKIANAQACIDSSTSATVNSCLSKIDGLESKSAYLLRCVAKFIEDGFNESTRLSQVFQQISNTSGASQGVQVMSILGFKNGATMAINKSNATQALTYCQNSESKGLIMLSALASTATTLSAFAVDSGISQCTTLDSTCLTNALNSDAVKNNPDAQALVGNAAIAAYNSNCTNGNTSSGSFCQQFGSAITQAGGSSSSAAVGSQIMTCYSNPAAAGCQGF